MYSRLNLEHCDLPFLFLRLLTFLPYIESCNFKRWRCLASAKDAIEILWDILRKQRKYVHYTKRTNPRSTKAENATIWYSFKNWQPFIILQKRKWELHTPLKMQQQPHLWVFLPRRGWRRRSDSGQPGILTDRLVEKWGQGRRDGYHGNRLLACTSSELRVAQRSFILPLLHSRLLCHSCQHLTSATPLNNNISLVSILRVRDRLAKHLILVRKATPVSLIIKLGKQKGICRWPS